jgi:NhaP-type Na+/H+ or K+/H+ antiporter
VWIFPATYLPRRLSAALARRDPAPPWPYVFALAFTGVRGIVSLAASLAIPLTTATGDPFPYRDLILFLTFAVILVTLVGQGLLLPAVIRWLGLANAGARERADDRVEELTARRLAIEAAIQRLEALGADSAYTDEFLEPVRSRYRERLRHVAHSSSNDEHHRRLSKAHDDIELELIEAERQALNDLYRDGGVKDEARRRIERAIDLREAHLRSLRGDPD